MADLTITAANVSGTVHQQVTAGATITAGQPVYRDTTDNNEYKPCDANAAASAVCAGIALHASLDGQPLAIQTSGSIDLGATLTIGEIYVVSDTAGGIQPIGDIQAGEFQTILGVATAADALSLDIQVSNTARA